MGHRNIETTMDIYAEATDQKKQESFNNLSKLDIFWEGFSVLILTTKTLLRQQFDNNFAFELNEYEVVWSSGNQAK